MFGLLPLEEQKCPLMMLISFVVATLRTLMKSCDSWMFWQDFFFVHMMNDITFLSWSLSLGKVLELERVVTKFICCAASNGWRICGYKRHNRYVLWRDGDIVPWNCFLGLCHIFSNGERVGSLSLWHVASSRQRWAAVKESQMSMEGSYSSVDVTQ